ncbi:MAG: hypothetical protein ABL959_14910 [Pyrinomonadaceae bacterium]
MIKILSRTLLMFLTTSLGLTAVWSVEHFERRADREIRDLSVSIVQPALLIYDEDPEYTAIVDSLRIGDFYETGRGCGNGFVQGYITFGRQRLWHGYESFNSVGEARRGFNSELAMASVIIEGPDTVIRDGNSATRFLLKQEGDVDTFYEIIWLEKRDDGFTTIAGPDEENVRLLETHVLRQR